jgi:hypothetical protein
MAGQATTDVNLSIIKQAEGLGGRELPTQLPLQPFPASPTCPSV